MNIDQDNYATIAGETAGIRLVVLPLRQMPFPEDDGITVMPGRVTYVGITQVVSLTLFVSSMYKHATVVETVSSLYIKAEPQVRCQLSLQLLGRRGIRYSPPQILTHSRTETITDAATETTTETTTGTSAETSAGPNRYPHIVVISLVRDDVIRTTSDWFAIM